MLGVVCSRCERRGRLRVDRLIERACRKLLALTAGRAWRSTLPSVVGGRPMILSAIAERLKRRSKDDFKGRHFEAPLILQAVSWYLRYSLSYRDIEELFRERGLAVDHSTLNRWVLAYAPLIERRLRSFRKPHCGSIRIDETYIKIRGQWRYLYRAIDKHGVPVDFLLTAKRDLEAAKRFFRKMLKDQPLLAPDRIGTDGAAPYPPAITAARKDGLLPQDPLHYVTKHLQQRIESDHFRVKRPMPRIGGFQSFHTARRTIRGFEAMLWLRKGFGFRRRLDGVRAEPAAVGLFRSAAGEQSVKLGSVQPIVRPAPEFATSPVGGRGERDPAPHAPDTEPGKRVTDAGARTDGRKALPSLSEVGARMRGAIGEAGMSLPVQVWSVQS